MDDDLQTYKGRSVIELDENAPLYKGDIVIIRFRWFLGGGGVTLKSAQLAAIDKQLAGRSDFVIRSYVDQGDFLDVEVEVLVSPPESVGQESVGPESGVTQAGLVVSTGVVVTAAVISAAIVYVTYLLLKYKTYRLELIESGVLPPPSSLKEVVTGLVYMAGAFVVLYLFRGRR